MDARCAIMSGHAIQFGIPPIGRTANQGRGMSRIPEQNCDNLDIGLIGAPQQRFQAGRTGRLWCALVRVHS
jgi:hypothetical protein